MSQKYTIQLGSPYTKQEIIDAFAIQFDAIHTFFCDIPHMGETGDEPSVFFSAPVEIWSPADNLVHLIISCSSVIQGLTVPKVALRMRFGKAKHESTTLVKVRTQYTDIALAGGGVAPAQYIPQVKEVSATERTRILAKWQEKGVAMGKAVNKWSEEELDAYVLPHPLLGKMTVREILFFTLYHNMHHVNDVQRLLNQPEVEWFEGVL
ncbi:MAG: DinB family protein [Chloroflexota bacterium]